MALLFQSVYRYRFMWIWLWTAELHVTCHGYSPSVRPRHPIRFPQVSSPNALHARVTMVTDFEQEVDHGMEVALRTQEGAQARARYP